MMVAMVIAFSILDWVFRLWALWGLLAIVIAALIVIGKGLRGITGETDHVAVEFERRELIEKQKLERRKGNGST